VNTKCQKKTSSNSNKTVVLARQPKKLPVARKEEKNMTGG
jgi:hypothetical protein